MRPLLLAGKWTTLTGWIRFRVPPLGLASSDWQLPRSGQRSQAAGRVIFERLGWQGGPLRHRRYTAAIARTALPSSPVS